MSNAKERGWGAIGPPGSSEGKQFRRENIVTIEAAGIELHVHEAAALLFKWFLDDAHAHGYRFDQVADDWGWCHRFIRGYEKGSAASLYDRLSNHSHGIAVDLNATKNPMTSDNRVHTDMPPWMIELAKKYGLSWGGAYSGKRKDPMHFEFLGTPAEARALVRRIHADRARQVAKPKEAPVYVIVEIPKPRPADGAQVVAVPLEVCRFDQLDGGVSLKANDDGRPVLADVQPCAYGDALLLSFVPINGAKAVATGKVGVFIATK